MVLRLSGKGMRWKRTVDEGSEPDKGERDAETLVCHLGRAPAEHAGMVNVPIYRGSTIVSETLEEWDIRNRGNPSYGRFGSPLSRALEAAVCKLEGGFRSILFPSGQSACTHALLACLKAGDSVLISDGVYGPVRAFADDDLARLQIKVQYFCPIQPAEPGGKDQRKYPSHLSGIPVVRDLRSSRCTSTRGDCTSVGRACNHGQYVGDTSVFQTF